MIFDYFNKKNEHTFMNKTSKFPIKPGSFKRASIGDVSVVGSVGSDLPLLRWMES